MPLGLKIHSINDFFAIFDLRFVIVTVVPFAFNAVKLTSSKRIKGIQDSQIEEKTIFNTIHQYRESGYLHTN